MSKFFKAIGLICIPIYPVVTYAMDDNTIFSRLDNNTNFNLSFENGTSNSDITAGLNASILSRNIWYSIAANGVLTNTSNGEPSQGYAGFALGGKVGYSFVVADNFNFIPYFGAGLSNYAVSAHTDSQAIFDYSFSNIDLMAGVKPEFAISNSVKLSLDTNFIYRQEAQVVPNTLTTQTHADLYNNYITTAPAIQWNPIGNFNVEIYYLFPIALTNNTPADNVINQGYSSQAIGNSAQLLDNTVGINLGWLF